jgi:hypothetical protein
MGPSTDGTSTFHNARVKSGGSGWYETPLKESQNHFVHADHARDSHTG